MKKKRKLRKGAKIILILMIVGSLAAVGFHVYNTYFRSDGHSATSISASATPAVETYSYNGAEYTIKPNVHSYLFMGIDTRDSSKTGTNNNGGQADVQLLLVMDDINKTWQLLQINRDSMVDVPILGIDGSVIDTEKKQICLAHGYGDGKKVSCINAVNAVSGMLDNRYIDGYLSLNYDGISVVNDDIGGVTVTVQDDFSKVDPTLVQGQTITLSGKQAVNYISGRGNVGDQTNISRMARQKEYLTGMLQKLSSVNVPTLTKVLNDTQDYVTSGIGFADMVSILMKMKKYENLGIVTIEGESKVEDGHVAYYLDEDSRKQAILKLYYQEVMPTASPSPSSTAK